MSYDSKLSYYQNRYDAVDIYSRIGNNLKLAESNNNTCFTIKEWLDSRYTWLHFGEIGMLVEDCGYQDWQLPLPRKYLHRMIPEVKCIMEWMKEYIRY